MKDMDETTMAHGGDIYGKKVKLDFSVNLNPLGMPVEVFEAAKDAVAGASFYPDPLQRKIRRDIAGRLGLDESFVYAGSGASDLIMAAVRAVRPGNAVLFEPSFSGYEYACRAAGCEITRLFTDEKNSFAIEKKDIEDASSDTDMIFVCSPANPSGKVAGDDVIEELIKTAHKKGAYVCLDESFLFLSDGALTASGRGEDDAKAPFVSEGFSRLTQKYDNLIIIRSLTKILASPGIRMGIAIASPMIIKRMAEQLSEWNLSVVSEAALEAGLKVIYETDFVRRTIKAVQRERAFLSDSLKEIGFTVYDSNTCFLLFKGYADLGDRLLQRGILIRGCNDFRGLGTGFYRTSVRHHEDNKELIEAMRGITNEL